MYPYIVAAGRLIPTYGICMAVAVVVGVLYAVRRCRGTGILPEDILILAACSVGMGICGAKLLYLLTAYSLPELAEAFSKGDFHALGESGLVFLGGLVFAVPGAALGAKLSKHKLSEYENYVVPALPFCHAIGRIGCLLAGCCYGVEYEGFAAVHYRNSLFELSPEQGYFPVQALEAFLNLLLFLLLHFRSRKERRPFDLLLLYFTLYAVERFFLEFLRGDAVRGALFGVSTSQWISIGLLMFCGGVKLISAYKKIVQKEK